MEIWRRSWSAGKSVQVCVSEVKSRIARTTKRQRSTRFPIDSSRNELAAFFAVPEVEMWRRSWSAGKFVPAVCISATISVAFDLYYDAC